MVRNQRGRILNISSVWGLVGASCEVAYSATKGAINSLTMALAKELAPSHIAVNAIAFGAVDTTMNAHLSVEEKKTLCEEIPAEKMAAPEEAARKYSILFNIRCRQKLYCSITFTRLACPLSFDMSLREP